MRRTEKANCPAGLAGSALKARIVLCEAAQNLSLHIMRFPIKPAAMELSKWIQHLDTVMLGNKTVEWPITLSRRYTAWVADDRLEALTMEESPHQQYVEVLYPLRPRDEDETATFDREDLVMWRVAPTEKDHQQYLDAVQRIQTAAADEAIEVTPEFEVAVSLAQEHYYFPELIKHAFSGERFTAMIASDPAGVVDICKCWLEKSETTVESTLESVRSAVAEIDDLCAAVVGFRSSEPNDDATHDAMSRVFGGGQPISEWTGSVVTAFRQSEGWDVLEEHGKARKGFEKANRDKFFAYKSAIIDDTNIQEVLEILPRWTGDKGFRPGTCDALEEKCFLFLEGRIKELVADTEDGTMDSGVRMRKLQAFSKCLDF